MLHRSTMGLDLTRGNGGRCPSCIVAGLLALCVFLICGWWSLGSQNTELLRQCDDLSEQLRINGEELDKCTRQKLDLEDRARNLQDGAAQQRVRLDQMKAAEAELKSKLQHEADNLGEAHKKAESAGSALHICTAELESLKKVSMSKDNTLETLRTEKKDLLKTIDDKESKIKELNEIIKSIKKVGQEKPPSIVHQMLKKPWKNVDNLDKNGVALGGNHDAAAAQDEDTAAEVKPEIEQPPAPAENEEDQRQIEMGQ